uniref:CSON010648 protein n=1 Tax=Culicoides sonorensis TaxID=179676 RepID=A0A336KHX7_CULSO
MVSAAIRCAKSKLLTFFTSNSIGDNKFQIPNCSSIAATGSGRDPFNSSSSSKLSKRDPGATGFERFL